MAANSIRERNQRLEIDLLLQIYPGLRLLPVASEGLNLAGTLTFSAQSPGFEQIEDSFEISLAVPQSFPAELPTVRETAGRIPRHFHTHPDGTLCLGAPTRQRLYLIERPTVFAFVQLCVIPYFYNFSYFCRYSILPLGELAHGYSALRQDYAQLFGVKTEAAAVELVRLCSMKKRIANKYPCPCGSGRRLGKCHNLDVNGYRAKLGCRWFRKEHSAVVKP